MKKYLKYSGFVAALFALITFILLLATPAVMYNGKNVVAEGTTAIFGKKEAIKASFGGFTVNFGDAVTHLSWSALLAWIFVVVALVILVAGVVLPLLKVKKIEKFAGLLNLVAVGLLVVAGIFVFISCATFFAANGYDSVPDKCALGAGWIIAGILAILGGACAILPAAVDFLGKKK